MSGASKYHYCPILFKCFFWRCRWFAISNFPRRRKEVMEKVSKAADKLATKLNDAMLKDLTNSVEKLNQFVEVISRPYVDAAQDRIDRSIEIQEELAKAEQNLQALRVEIQNLHVS